MKKIMATLVSLFSLTTALANPQPQPEEIKFILPKEDKEILELKKKKEALALKLQMQRAKQAYEIDRLVFKLQQERAKRNYLIEKKKLQIFREVEKLNPAFFVQINGIVGDVAITPLSIAMTEGSYIYNQPVKDISISGIKAGKQYLNVFYAVEDSTIKSALKEVLVPEKISPPKQSFFETVSGGQNNTLPQPFRAMPVGGRR